MRARIRAGIRRNPGPKSQNPEQKSLNPEACRLPREVRDLLPVPGFNSRARREPAAADARHVRQPEVVRRRGQADAPGGAELNVRDGCRMCSALAAAGSLRGRLLKPGTGSRSRTSRGRRRASGFRPPYVGAGLGPRD